jgi:hypothetical protein
VKNINFLFILTLLLLIIILLNKDTTRTISINYKVTEYSIPIHLKINDFFNRHFNYKYLVNQINPNSNNSKDFILNTAKWVNQNIKKIPEGVDVIDNHPLTIIQRRLGAQDQFNDILSVFLIYLDIDSFFISKLDNTTHPLTLFKVNNYWSLLDPYYGIYFINEKENFASIEELKKSNWQIVNLDSQTLNLKELKNTFPQNFTSYEELEKYYKKIFSKIPSSLQIDDTNIFERGGRSYIQKPLNRLKFEIFKLMKGN